MNTNQVEIQRQAIIKKFCNRCCYFWFTDGCQYDANKTGDVIAECHYSKEMKSISAEE